MKVNIDRKAFSAVANDLKAANEAIVRGQYRAINKVAAKTLTRSRREINSRVNLTQTYIRERMEVRNATSKKLEASIVARVRGTRLATYGAKQVTVAAKNAKGDSRRGIAPGRKQGGVTVAVKKGNGRKKISGAFLIPLRAGKAEGANGFGVFTRSGKTIKHRYGPSVHQVFRGVIDDIDDDVRAELVDAITKQTDYELKKALK